MQFERKRITSGMDNRIVTGLSISDVYDNKAAEAIGNEKKQITVPTISSGGCLDAVEMLLRT
jgi:hypothetical protein